MSTKNIIELDLKIKEEKLKRELLTLQRENRSALLSLYPPLFATKTICEMLGVTGVCNIGGGLKK